MCVCVCLCVPAYMHWQLTKQQYRFNYRRPSSCLSLCYSVSVWVCICVLIVCACVRACACVCVSFWTKWGGAVSVGKFNPMQLHCTATFMFVQLSWLLRTQHLYCCVCQLVFVISNTCMHLKTKCDFFYHFWRANPKMPLLYKCLSILFLVNSMKFVIFHK